MAKAAWPLPTGAERSGEYWAILHKLKLLSAMKRKTSSPRTDPHESEIQHAAYMLWIEEGRPEGRDLEHWHAAREMLCHRRGRDSKTGRRVPEITRPAPVASAG